MSNLTGHWKITQQAVTELATDWKSNPLLRGLGSAGLPEAAVTRDILDVLCLGHWADFGQKHHFMRQFDGQSPYEAYQSALEWVRSNALEAAGIISTRLPRYMPKGPGAADEKAGRELYYGRVVRTGRGAAITDQPSWQSLGNAVHCTEDSFAAGHVSRGAPLSATTPGLIEYIKRYTGEEKKGHEEADEAWEEHDKNGKGTGKFSPDGRFAINAVKDLIMMVIVTGQSKPGTKPPALLGWPGFVERWLKASPDLSKKRDQAFELIDRYTTAVRIGNNNLKTLNMDEEGLAKALVNEAGTDTATLRAVFAKLDESYNSDADDVAELYVNLVKQRGGAPLMALKSDKELIQRLIKVMDEGWTSSGEKECIKFLKSLK